MRCLVTGAGGFIGRGLVSELVDRGCEVTALRRSVAAHLPTTGAARERRWDLASADAEPDCHGADIVFHLAGVAHQYAEADAYQSLNVDGSLRLARAAIDAGVRRFVFFSSVKALTAAAATSGADGEQARDYASSKALAERRLRDLCRNTVMELVILRPALVYAPNSPGHLAWLRRWADLHLPRPPEIGARSMVARDDLLRIAVAFLDLARSVPGEVTATDGEVYSLRRIHAALCAAAGKTPWLPSPPVPVWRAMAHTFDGLRGQPRGTTWERLSGVDVYAATGLEALGVAPALTLETCLATR